MKNALIKTNSNHKGWLLAAALYAAVFLITRLTNIRTFPLYIDETTHIFVAKLTENGDFFVGLSETAKQMYVWMVALAFQIFDDPIFAARAVSVISGLITAGICYKLTNLLYPQRNVGYLAALFYLISPFAVLFDRMALADSLLATLVGGSLLASVYLWRAPSLKWAIVLGLMFALATLNKAYAVFYYPAPILLWLIMGRTISWRKIAKFLSITYGIASMAWLMIFFIGFLSYQDYLLKKSITGGSEADFLLRSWHFSLLMVEWLTAYLTWPLVGLLLFVTLRVVFKGDRAGLVMIILVVASLAAFATAFTDLYSRYLFPDIVPLSVMIAWGIDELARLVRSLISRLPGEGAVRLSGLRVAIQLLLLLAFCFSAALFSYLIITKPAQAPLPLHDKTSYVVDAQSAQGYGEMARLIEDLTHRSTLR